MWDQFINSPFIIFNLRSQLMDPKMDQCYKVTSSINIPDLMKVQIPEKYSLSSIVKIFQALIVHETSFLDGASPLESTHRCTLMWEGAWEHVSSGPDSNSRAVLAFVKSLDRSMASVTKCVLAADIYEGESKPSCVL
jgi:Mak10 subunit, NatC N(alpha)-terminal acetyltransferase